MYCINCGNELSDTAMYCGKCGLKVGSDAPREKKKSAFTKRRAIIITAIGCILIAAIVMGILFWDKLSQGITESVESTTANIEESVTTEDSVTTVDETEETTEEVEENEELEAEPEYYLAKETHNGHQGLEYVIEYDSTGNKISYISYNQEGSISITSESEYDNLGNLIKEERYEAWSDEKWLLEYEYDSAGNLLKTISYVNGEVAFVTEYNSKGECIYSVDNYYFLEKQEFKYEYEYDDRGNCLFYKEYYYPQGDIYDMKEKKYDEEGRIVEERTYENTIMSFWDYRCFYTYDKNGNLIIEEAHSYNQDGTESGFTETIYEYKSKEVFENSSADESADTYSENVTNEYYLERKIRYHNGLLDSDIEYDSAGNEIKSIGYNGDGSIYSWREHEYDSAGNMIISIIYNGDGSVNRRSESEYNSAGNKLSSKTYNGDGSVISRSEYEYDDVGNCIRRVAYNDEIESIYIKFESNYEYDNNGNLIREQHDDYHVDGSVFHKETIYEYAAICESNN